MYRPRARRFRKVATYSTISLALISALGVVAAQASGAATKPATTITIPPLPGHGREAPDRGPGEALLTGAALASATSAAETAVPGATVLRAETDPSGKAMYEVYMKKADGTFVTVKLDSSFKVLTTTTGFGPGPKGTPPFRGSPDKLGLPGDPMGRGDRPAPVPSGTLPAPTPDQVN